MKHDEEMMRREAEVSRSELSDIEERAKTLPPLTWGSEAPCQGCGAPTGASLTLPDGTLEPICGQCYVERMFPDASS